MNKPLEELKSMEEVIREAHLFWLNNENPKLIRQEVIAQALRKEGYVHKSTRPQANIEEVVSKFTEKCNEVRRISLDKDGDSDVYEFGYKTRKGDEMWNVVDFGNMVKFLRQNIPVSTKPEIDEAKVINFLIMYAEDKKNRYRTDLKDKYTPKALAKAIIKLINIKIECKHNGYTIRNVCNDCGKNLNKEESDRCCNGG